MEEKLIEAVRNRKVIYDTNDVNYMKSKLKQQLWEEIALEVGLKTGSEAKIMWDKLRHSYRDSIRRQEKCIRSGAPATTQKQWRFQKEMGFLQRYMANRKRDTNFSDEEPTQNCNELECEDNKSEEDVGEDVDRQQIERAHEDSSPNMPSTSTSFADTPSVPRQERVSNIPGCSTNKRQIHTKDHVVALLKQSAESRDKRAAERSMEREILLGKIQRPNDPLYHFFMSMYEITKKMPLQSQYIVRNNVYKAVSDEEGKLLNIPQPSTINIYPSSAGSTPFTTYSDSSSQLVNISHFSPEPLNISSEKVGTIDGTLVNFINEFSTD